MPILCLTSAHGCSFPSALPNQMIICGGCSLSSLISQNFLFLRIFVSLLVSAIGTFPHHCLWVQTSHYSFFLLYHYSLQGCVPWHKCCLGYYLGVLQFDSSVSLHYLSQIKLHVMCFAYCSHCFKFDCMSRAASI